MRWGRSRRYSSANLPALRAGDGGIFPSADGGAVSLSGSAMPDFHPSPGAANGGRSVTAQPYDGRLLGDWLHRLRPPLETISPAGWASPAARIWRIFSMPPARRAPRCMLCCPPPAAPRLAAATRRTGAASGQWQCAGRPSAAIRPRRRRAFSAQCPGGPAAAGSAGRVRRGAAQRRRGDSRRSWRRGAGLRRFSPRSPAAGAGGASRCGGLRPFLRRTAGQSGRGIRLGESVGGQFDTSLRHPLARAPVSRVTLASGQQLMFPHLVERAKPGVIAVLPNGKRFVNEADSYHDFIAALLAATPAGDTPQARCWPIVARCVATARATPDRSRSLPPPGCVPAICSEETPWRSWRSSALSTPMRWRKPLNALTTSPALAKTSIFTAGHQPITAPRVTIR